MNTQPFVYALVDPAEPGHVRYVGLTIGYTGRPFSHARSARKLMTPDSYCVNWIRSIQSEGREPSILILEELAEGTSRSLLGFVEQCYIKSLRELGHRLTNLTAGGDGLIDPTPEVRKKISKASQGNKHALGLIHTAEAKEAQRQASLGNRHALGLVHSQVTRTKISASNKGVPKSAEHAARIGQSLVGNKNGLGHHHTEAYKESQSKCMLGNTLGLGHKHTDETKKIISISRLGNTAFAGRKHTEDTLTLMQQKAVEGWKNQEIREKRVVSLKAAWITRRANTEAKKQCPS